MTQYFWKAEVTLAGIPSLSEEDALAMQEVMPMIIRYEANSSRLFLSWRFVTGTQIAMAAIELTRYTMGRAFGVVLGEEGVLPDATCTDFRVYRVDSL